MADAGQPVAPRGQVGKNDVWLEPFGQADQVFSSDQRLVCFRREPAGPQREWIRPAATRVHKKIIVIRPGKRYIWVSTHYTNYLLLV
jgi:hypothetical protein